MASLVLAVTLSAANVNVASLGADDWAIWAGLTGTPSQRKSGGGSLIGNATAYGGATQADYGGDARTISWTGGAPTASGSTTNGIYFTGLTNAGYEVVFPADTTTRKARLYLGSFVSGAIITAILSDGSVPNQVDSTTITPGGEGFAVVDYAAGSAGQTMTIRVQITTGSSWNVTAQAATVQVTGGGGTNIAPGAASLAASGYAPTVSQPRGMAPGVASLAVTGYVPTIAQPRNVAPGAAALAVVGYAPTVAQTANKALAPGAAALVVTGYAPTLAQPRNVAPGVASLAIMGYAPALAQTANKALTPGAAALTLTGYAPTVSQPRSVAPDAAALSVTGYAPTVSQGTARILDKFPGSFAAYSCRKLRAAYAGAPWQIRRSSDNATFDVPFDANGDLDEVAALAFVGANDAFLSIEYDQSGLGLDEGQTTLALQPKVISAGVFLKQNGRPSVLSDGVDDVMASAFAATAMATARKVSMAVVFRPLSNVPASAGIVALQRSLAYDFQSGYVFEKRASTFSGTPGTGNTGAFNATQSQAWTWPNSNVATLQFAQTMISSGSGGIQLSYVNGALQTLTSISGSMPLANFMSTGSGAHRLALFARANNSNGFDSWVNGYMSELILWPDDLLTANAAAIYADQLAYFTTPPVNIAPGPAALTLTGYAPTLVQTANQSLAPGVASLVVTGYPPGVLQSANRIVSPGAAALTVTGYAPAVLRTSNQTVAPAAASLAVIGYAPTVEQSADVELTPGPAALAVTGYAPTVVQAAPYVWEYSPRVLLMMADNRVLTLEPSQRVIQKQPSKRVIPPEL